MFKTDECRIVGWTIFATMLFVSVCGIVMAAVTSWVNWWDGGLLISVVSLVLGVVLLSVLFIMDRVILSNQR